MNDQAKIERVLKLIMLLSGTFGYSSDEIAEKLEISKRTVYRYIETLRNVGFVFEKNEEGYRKLKKQDKNNRNLHDLLQFSEEESFILQKAIHSIDDNNVLKSNLVKKLYSLYDSKRVIDTIIRKEKSEVISKITAAILNKKQIKIIDYKSAHSNSVSSRLAEPLKYTPNFVSVWCYEIESGKNKLFKTSRIKNVEILPEDWQYQKYHKAGHIDCFRISSDKRIFVKLILTMRAYNLLIEEYPLSEKDIKKTENGEYIFESEVCSFHGVGRFVLGLPDDIQVAEPLEFKNYLNEKIKNKIF